MGWRLHPSCRYDDVRAVQLEGRLSLGRQSCEQASTWLLASEVGVRVSGRAGEVETGRVMVQTGSEVYLDIS